MTNPTLVIDPKSQAPSLNDAEGEYESTGSSNSAESNFNPSEDVEKMQQEVQQLQDDLEKNKFLTRSIQAFEASDKFFNSSIRPRLNDSIKSYNNQHTSGSVFGSDDAGNNTIFRPKTRSVINKYTAAAAAAFFSNLDVVSIEAENASDKAEVLSAEIVKALINYRTTKVHSLVSHLFGWHQRCLDPIFGVCPCLLGCQGQ